MENDAQFHSYYINQLEPQLDALEVERKKVKNKILILLLIGTVGYAILITIGDFYNLKHCKSSNSKKQQILQHVVNNFM